jgi:ATP-dependent Clp protease ATP-binding subunit ClpB
MPRVNRRLDTSRTGQEAERLRNGLTELVVGQDDAINQIVGIYQTWLAGMTTPGRPIGNLLFLGPTGTGKTRLVEATGELLLGSARAVLKIDCAEFQHSHEIAKLIGSPPGYLGHRETHALFSQDMLDRHHSVDVKISFVLFDEIEKASDALWNLLLGILDKATLTLGDNRRVDFSKTMIFMTSNLGAAQMAAMLRPKLGFAVPEHLGVGADLAALSALDEKSSRVGVEAAKRRLAPEFMNRIDKVVVFRRLGNQELDRILSLELNRVQERIFASGNPGPFIFELTGDARSFLLREGADMEYGARHLKRVVEKRIVHPLSNLVASNQIGAGDLIRIEFDSALKMLSFVTEAEDLPMDALVQLTRPHRATCAASANCVIWERRENDRREKHNSWESLLRVPR